MKALGVDRQAGTRLVGVYQRTGKERGVRAPHLPLRHGCPDGRNQSVHVHSHRLACSKMPAALVPTISPAFFRCSLLLRLGPLMVQHLLMGYPVGGVGLVHLVEQHVQPRMDLGVGRGFLGVDQRGRGWRARAQGPLPAAGALPEVRDGARLGRNSRHCRLYRKMAGHADGTAVAHMRTPIRVPYIYSLAKEPSRP